MAVCDFDCFHCRFPDCIAGIDAIMRDENGGVQKYHRHDRPAPTGFAKIVIDYRKGLKLTQRQFAALLGISSTAVGLWEIGRNVPAQKTWDKIVLQFPDLAQYRNEYERKE